MGSISSYLMGGIAWCIPRFEQQGIYMHSTMAVGTEAGISISTYASAFLKTWIPSIFPGTSGCGIFSMFHSSSISRHEFYSHRVSPGKTDDFRIYWSNLFNITMWHLWSTISNLMHKLCLIWPLIV